MNLTESQKQALQNYIDLDRQRCEAKQHKTFASHPLDALCIEAWSAVREMFGAEASDALYRFMRSDAPPPRADAPARAPRATRAGGAAVRDPRIPPPGTVIKKVDRHGKVLAEAAVREDGIEYAGVVYKSPSAAGLAASIAIGGTKTAVDGYTFWGLNMKKETR